MGNLSIKIKIADREYPMKVDAEEEARIRKAGKDINESIRTFKNKFQIDDKQDLLAMVAFDSYVKGLQKNDHQEDDTQDLVLRVRQLNNLISQSL